MIRAAVGRLPTWVAWALCILLIATIGYPLSRLFLGAFVSDSGFGLDSFQAVLGASWFPKALGDTAWLVGVTTVSAVLIGCFMAWANERTDASFGWLGQILPLTPLVIPGIAVGTGWVLLASPKVGFISQFVEQVPWLDALLPGIFSLPGLIFVQTLVLVPYVYLLVQPAFRNLDPALEEASQISGASRLRTLATVSFPALRNSIVGALLLAAVVSIGEFSVPAVIASPARLDILSIRAARYITADYPSQPGRAAVVGMLMLIVTASLWFAYSRIAKRERFAQIGSKPARNSLMKLGAWRWPVRVVMLLFLLAAAVLPLTALLVVAFQPYWTPNVDPTTFGWQNFTRVLADARLGGALANSAQFASIAAIVTVIIVGVLTAAQKVSRFRGASIALAVVKLPASVASVVLGIAILIAYFGRPFYLGGTALILIGAYVIVSLPQASILAESATSQVRRELLEASEISGATRARTSLRVLVPLALPGYVSALALLFATLAGEVSVSRLLAQPGTEVVGFSIIQVYETGGFGSLAALSVLLAAVIFIVVSSALLISRALRNRW